MFYEFTNESYLYYSQIRIHLSRHLSSGFDICTMNLSPAFDKFPVLLTENLVFRELQQSDLENIFRLYSNENVVTFLGRDLYTSIQQAQEYLDTNLENYKNKLSIRWALAFKENPEMMIGDIGYKCFIPEHHRAEINYFLLPEYWGKKIMTVAIGKLTDFAFRELKLHSLEANIDKDNIASRRALEKNGFVQEAHFKENYFYKGKFIDSVIFSAVSKDRYEM